VLSPNRIALKVAPESSQLDFVNSVTISGVAVPGITTRRADTTVELGDGESFVIGGLIDRQTMSNVSKVPLLGDLPIIGTFFKNLNYQQNDKELLIIVTPHLVAPIAKGAVLPATPGDWPSSMTGRYGVRISAVRRRRTRRRGFRNEHEARRAGSPRGALRNRECAT
jgi:pilus assembly protein CpaC